MLLFIVIVSIVFLFASQRYFIVGKKRHSNLARYDESFTRVAFFMLICSLIWLAIKFAMRFSGAMLIALIIWFVIKELISSPKKTAVSAEK